MKKMIVIPFLATALFAYGGDGSLRQNFENPPNEYLPMPFWHLNGHLTTEGIRTQITQAHELSGYGGMTVLPVSAGNHVPKWHLCPGMTPEYLSEEYFDRYADMLEVSKELGTEIILYDDIDFPSGTAGGRLAREFPKYTSKMLYKDEFVAKGGARIEKKYEMASNEEFIALSAMDTTTLEVVDLQPFLKDRVLQWNAPAGVWRVMSFTYKYNDESTHHRHTVDYMQPEAVAKVIEMTYDSYAKRFSQYFGNVITKTFFDDVGFVSAENLWSPQITEIFRAKTGKNPALYYPALFYDIGPQTAAARVAFFDARSELMAEGYVRQAAEWSAKHNLRSMGHPPENYSPNSVVANGDILKFYRHVQIPLLDVIFFTGRGLNGYKQIASAADLGDKPLVGAELNGAFRADMDSLALYRVALDAMVRGVNFVVPHGLWYDNHPDSVRIPPVISFDSEYLGSAVPNYSFFVGRSCAMLQGGRRVVDVAMLWPVTAIQGGTYMYRDATSGMPVANWLPQGVNHYTLSGMLTNELHRDFTYIHPEDLINGKVTAKGSELVLNNKINAQNYKVLIMPGGEVISEATLRAIKSYYDNGGKVIATSMLPMRAAEFGKDGQVNAIVESVFGKYPAEQMLVSNDRGGQFAFVPDANTEKVGGIMEQMGIVADVAFDDSALPTNHGYVNYTHKIKDGKQIYYFTNTTDGQISTTVSLNGKLKNPEVWNPHTGTMEKITDVKQTKDEKGNRRVSFVLSIPAVSSVFVVGNV